MQKREFEMFRQFAHVNRRIWSLNRGYCRKAMEIGMEESPGANGGNGSEVKMSSTAGGAGVDGLIRTTEGKVELEHGSSPHIFYNPIQEVNRDISILGIDTFIRQEQKENVTILEAMAASGIRSIRYAKEIEGIATVIANDYSKDAIESITKNSELNGVAGVVKPSFMDASGLMHSQHNIPLVVDLDPYGTPIPYLDAAVQCVADGGLLLVTATDMAVLAGNTPETCYAKYGAMSLKSHACHEMALRILVHAVQGFANRYGRYVEPLVSLKIDFYARLLFRVTRSPKKCKDSVTFTSMVFQCTGCTAISFQPLATRTEDPTKSGTPVRYHFAQGPQVPQRCSVCSSAQHIGGPIWTGPLQSRPFISAMLDRIHRIQEPNAPYAYLRTAPRIAGLLTVLLEELDTPLFYSTAQACSVLRCNAVPLLKLRSALLNAGFQVSGSHASPTALKTTAPPAAFYAILAAWASGAGGGGGGSAKLTEGSAGHLIMAKYTSGELIAPSESGPLVVDFSIHPDANPASRAQGVLRYQRNPGPNWGPGMRGTYDAMKTAGAAAASVGGGAVDGDGGLGGEGGTAAVKKRTQNQGKRKGRKRVKKNP